MADFGSKYLANVQSVQKFDNALWNLHPLKDHKGQKVKIPTGAKSARGCQSEVKNRLFFGEKSKFLKFLKFFFLPFWLALKGQTNDASTIFFWKNYMVSRTENRFGPLWGVTKLWKLISPPRGVGGHWNWGHNQRLDRPSKWAPCHLDPPDPMCQHSHVRADIDC